MGTSQTSTTKTGAERLSGNVVPESYEMLIEPDISAASFRGEMTVKLAVLESTSSIVLNSAEIEIQKASLRSESGKNLSASVSTDEIAQQSTIKLSDTASGGNWYLHLSFTGILNNKLRGFYRSSYKDAEGKEQFIATTKFEPSDARRAFPCFDEPAFKATFQVSLLIDKELTAIANTPLLSEEEKANGKKLLKFAPSMKMSSYLVAYMVGHFEASEPVDSNGTPIRIWTVPGKQHLTAYALEAAKFSLDYFADYFRKPYPGEKLDLIAIPDFASGAMENFGAITFRETALLLDQSTATNAELKRVAEVICHENAHMWFGDLVTMSWWNGLWLNEAFATFMAAKAVDLYKPEWKFWEGFNIEKAGAMRIDGLHSSRSIEFPVETPEGARAMFDVLTYEKGCAILRMLELFIGEEVFRHGCEIYMDRHEYGSTETVDLWKALQEAVDKTNASIPVAEMMDSWVFQQGFPLVTLTEEGEDYVLRQEPFRYLKSEEQRKMLWYIPVKVKLTYSGQTVKHCCLLSEDESHWDLKTDFDMVVLNADAEGFYRVKYADVLLSRILDNISSLTNPERFNVLSDAWAATLAGNTSLKQYLNAVQTLVKTETDLNVYTVILGSLASLRRAAWAAGLDRAAFTKLAGSIVLPTLEKIGWESKANEASQNAELRAAILSSLGSMGEPSVKAFLESKWRSYLQDKKTVDPNLLPAVVDTMAAHGDPTLYEQMKELKDKAATPQEESRFLFALAGFRKKDLIERTLEAALDGTVRVQDSPMMLRALLYNPDGGRICWEFIKKNWQRIVAIFPLQGIIRLCDGLTALVDPALEADIRSFAANLQVKGNEKALAQNLETLAIANRFLEREQLAIAQLLSTQNN